VYCDTPQESRRIFGKQIAFGVLRDKNEEAFTLVNLVMSGSFIVCPSKDIADYEEPIPKRPLAKNIYLDDNSRKYIEDLNKYCDHLESKIKELESNVFVPFKVKCVSNLPNATYYDSYDVLALDTEQYVIKGDDGILTIYLKNYFTKL
jgi:hypothetical protein